jgi:hemerythrin-like domain-containing protein
MKTSDVLIKPRRSFVRAGLILAGASFLGVSSLPAQAHQPGGKPQKPQERDEKGGDRPEEAEVGPAEDLMREHGVLTRVLLVYEETARRLEAGTRDFSPDSLKQSAELVRSFVEDYHEKLEEHFLFPRFKTANELADLVTTLQTQHNAGRRVTDRILRLATETAFKEDADRQKLPQALRQFIHMYLPHAAREDTVLFPAFRRLVPGTEYDSLGDEFEEKEHQLFGEDGFEAVVNKVAGIEKQLGIYDLTQFTPKA